MPAPDVAGYLTKADRAVAAIRRALELGEIVPGDRIRAEEWAKKLGLSATPVREALRQLEAERLVTIHAHRGAQVASFTESEFVEVYRIRGALEPLALEIAMNRLSAAQCRALCEELAVPQERYHSAAASGDIDAARAANRDFHMRLYQEAASPHLFTMITSIWALLPFDTLHLRPDRVSTSVGEHDRLIEAILDGNAPRACQILKEHIQSFTVNEFHSEADPDSSFFFADFFLAEYTP